MFKVFEEVVLYNDCGCELDREIISDTMSYEDIVSQWVIYPGDTIKIEYIEHEID